MPSALRFCSRMIFDLAGIEYAGRAFRGRRRFEIARKLADFLFEILQRTKRGDIEYCHEASVVVAAGRLDPETESGEKAAQHFHHRRQPLALVALAAAERQQRAALAVLGWVGGVPAFGIDDPALAESARRARPIARSCRPPPPTSPCRDRTAPLGPTAPLSRSDWCRAGPRGRRTARRASANGRNRRWQSRSCRPASPSSDRRRAVRRGSAGIPCRQRHWRSWPSRSSAPSPWR